MPVAPKTVAILGILEGSEAQLREALDVQGVLHLRRALRLFMQLFFLLTNGFVRSLRQESRGDPPIRPLNTRQYGG